jgi:transposase
MPCVVVPLRVDSLIAPDHPLREIKQLAAEVLGRMDKTFDAMYAALGRDSIPPETLLLARLLQALYTIRSDRMLCERITTDMLFRWFLDIPLDQAVFDASTFSKNQERLLRHEVARQFFTSVVDLAAARHLLSREHFTVDGTLIQAWASMKSFRPRDEDPKGPKGPGEGGSNGWVDFSGEKRSNDTHESTTDPEAKLVKKGKGQPAMLSFLAHATMENRNGLFVAFDMDEAVGTTESEMAVEQAADLRERGFRPLTVGADKGYHCAAFVNGMRGLGVTPHPARHSRRKSMGVRFDSVVHAISQVIRKRVEEPFGWLKTVGNLRKSRWIGVARTEAAGLYAIAALNLLRIAKLGQGPPKTALA